MKNFRGSALAAGVGTPESAPHELLGSSLRFYLGFKHRDYYYTLQSVHRFNNNIRNMFSEIKERGITNLILDLRNNPGGNQAIAIEFFKYLPIDKYQIGKNEIRRGPFLFQTNGIRRNRFIKDLCFNGNIYVLTSLQTFSAAMIFADMLQGNNLAIVIGEVPGNAATEPADFQFHIFHNKIRCACHDSGDIHIEPDITQNNNYL